VRVDAARDDKLARGVDDAVDLHLELCADGRNDAVLDKYIGFVVVDGGNDAAVCDQGFHIRC
jgi:hypothetical protein